MEKIGETTLNTGSIRIKSNIPLTYDSRNQKKDIIYITIKRWNYDQFFYIAEVFDYRKLEDGKYEVINHKFKSFPKETVNYLFNQLKPMISEDLSYSDYLNSLLTLGLLIDTQTSLIGENTVYGGNPQDWEITHDDVIEPIIIKEPIVIEEPVIIDENPPIE